MTLLVEDDATTASADSFSNDNIDVTKSPAAISWLDNSGQKQQLCHSPVTHDHVTLDIKFDAELVTALFKITINVSLKGKRNKTNLFLFIYPEHIQKASLVDQGEDGYLSATSKLGTTTFVVTFELSTPVALVVPDDGCVPKNEATRSTLFLLRDLAEKSSFSVAFPKRAISKDRLVAVCQELSTQNRVRTMSSLANTSKLYGGKGGRVVRPGEQLYGDSMSPAETNPHDLAPTAQASNATQSVDEHVQVREGESSRQGQSKSVENPPSYDELHEESSLPNYSRARGKRRRVGSDESLIEGKESLRLEEICRRGFNEIGDRLGRIEQSLGILGSRLDRAEDRIYAIEGQLSHSRSSEQKDRPASGLASRVDGIEARVDKVEEKIETGLSELATDTENQIYDVRHEVDDMISVRVADEMGVAQSELEDFVKDEMHNITEDIEQAVRERLRDALA